MSLVGNQVLRSTLSFCLAIIGGIIGIVGVMLMKGIPVAVSMTVIFGLKNVIRNDGWRWIVAIALFWLTLWLVSWRITAIVAGWGVRLIDYGKTFKKSYASIYGDQYKAPAFEQFGLRAEDYYAYNKRFQFDISGQLLTWAPFFGVMYLGFKFIPERGLVPMFKIMAPASALALSIYSLLKSINHQLSKRWPQHEQVKAYERASTIYKKIEEETREKRVRVPTP